VVPEWRAGARGVRVLDGGAAVEEGLTPSGSTVTLPPGTFEGAGLVCVEDAVGAASNAVGYERFTVQ
jgi:hypothetical protein